MFYIKSHDSYNSLTGKYPYTSIRSLKHYMDSFPDCYDDYDNENLLLLHVLCRHAEAKVVKYYLNYTNKVNAKSIGGFREYAIHEAIGCVDLKKVCLLIDAGADISVVCKRGKTPLEYAISLYEICQSIKDPYLPLVLEDIVLHLITVETLRKAA